MDQHQLCTGRLLLLLSFVFSSCCTHTRRRNREREREKGGPRPATPAPSPPIHMLWPAELFSIPPPFFFSNSFYICTCTSAFITRAIYSIIHHRGHAFFDSSAAAVAPDWPALLQLGLCGGQTAAEYYTHTQWRQCNPPFTAQQHTHTKVNRKRNYRKIKRKTRWRIVWTIRHYYDMVSVGNFQLKNSTFKEMTDDKYLPIWCNSINVKNFSWWKVPMEKWIIETEIIKPLRNSYSFNSRKYTATTQNFTDGLAM